MAYLALYRKLRPKTFEEVVGQKYIVKTLKNQIDTDRVSHAYLFCGTRGTGKTSVAKIFAKVLNCENSINSEPCLKCDSCLSTEQGISMNVIEIDAASNNGVDNIREIREEVKYSPAKGNYKIYIIDEVHMLSPGAFNALLKTLEEPPKHVVFILATTDPQKIPVTVLSRCQRFDFKRILATDIAERLKEYTTESNIKIEDAALEYISKISDGALRDALSILDQAIAFYFDSTITLTNVLELTGSVNNEIFYKFINALYNRNINESLEIINSVLEDGRDLNQFIQELIIHIRNILVAKNLQEDSNSLNLSTENIDRLKEQGKTLENTKLIDLINVFSETLTKTKYTSNPRVILEITCLELCSPQTKENFSNILERISLLEKKLNNTDFTITEKKNYKEKIILSPSAVPEDVKNVQDNWKSFITKFNAVTKKIFEHSHCECLDKNTLTIVAKNIEYLELKEQLILEELEKMFKKSFTISFMSEFEFNEKYIKENIDSEKDSQNKSFTDTFGADIITEE